MGSSTVDYICLLILGCKLIMYNLCVDCCLLLCCLIVLLCDFVDLVSIVCEVLFGFTFIVFIHLIW